VGREERGKWFFFREKEIWRQKRALKIMGATSELQKSPRGGEKPPSTGKGKGGKKKRIFLKNKKSQPFTTDRVAE